MVTLKAWRLQQPDATRWYRRLRDVFIGDKYFTSFVSTSGKESIQLDITQLLQDAAAAYDQHHQQGSTPVGQQAVSEDVSTTTASTHDCHTGTSNDMVTAQQLLQYASSRTWHATKPQLNAVRRAVAVYLIKQANPALLSSSPAPVAIEPAAYAIESSAAGKHRCGHVFVECSDWDHLARLRLVSMISMFNTGHSCPHLDHMGVSIPTACIQLLLLYELLLLCASSDEACCSLCLPSFMSSIFLYVNLLMPSHVWHVVQAA